MPEFVSMFLDPLIAAIVGALVGAMVARIKSVTQESAEQRAEDRAELEAMKEGIKSLLRSEIMRLHHECAKRGSCTTVEREVMEREFAAYTGLDGNGVAKTLYSEFGQLPTVDD